MRRCIIAIALLILPLLLALQQTDVPAPKGLDLAAFKTWDLHSRWVAYRDNITARRDTAERWVAFLDDRDDFELLEQLAIYEGFQQLFGKGKPGEVLYRRDAKQWMRVALWNIRQPDSHGQVAATNPLEQNPGRFLGWAKKYKEVARLGGATLLKKFEAQRPVDPGDQLRPLDPQVIVLPFLDAPRAIETLQIGGVRDPRQRYLHEVLRAIGAVSITARFDEPYRGKLLRLTRHPHARIRRAAMLEFSEFPADKIPYRGLLQLIDDPALPAEDRRIATLAVTYCRQPDVYLRVHEILRDPKHPGFGAVVNRMAAIGDEYSLHVLDGLDDRQLDAKARVAVAGGRRTLLNKLSPRGKKKLPYSPDVGRRMRVVFQAQRLGHPGAAAFEAWTDRYLREKRKSNPSTRQALTVIANKPGSSTMLPKRDRASAAAWARRLLQDR